MERCWTAELELLVQHTMRKANAGVVGTRELANMAYGAAVHSHVGKSPVALFVAVATAAQRCVRDFNAQGCANMAWAFASVKRSFQKLFTALAALAEEQVSKFNAKGLVNTAWAFAAVRRSNAKLFMSLALAAEGYVFEFGAQGIANMAWAYAIV